MNRGKILRRCGGLFTGGLLSAQILLNSAAAAPVTMEFQGADIRGVFSTLAELGDMGLVLDDSVRGTVTISLNDIEPWEAAQLIAAAKGLSLSRQDDTIVVTTHRAGGRGLYRMNVFPVKYAELATIVEAVDMAFGDSDSFRDYERDDYRGREMAARPGQYNAADHSGQKEYRRRNDDERRVLADAQTNSIIFYGTEQEAAEVQRLISDLDRPAKQVSLEARVLAIQDDAAKKLGVEWDWSAVPQYPQYETEYESRRHTVQNPDGSYATVTEDIPRTTVARNWGGKSYGIVNFGRSPEGHPFEFYYGATINALVANGKAKILARPNITTVQGKAAVINIGSEVPVTETSVTNSTTTTSVKYRDAGIILRYTPRVNPDGTITAAIHTEVSSPTYVESLKAYRFQTRSADTTVVLQDGETMIIGGLIGKEDAKSVRKIPFLGDLPILGALFRSHSKSRSDSELMIFLTARVLDTDRARAQTKEAEERLKAREQAEAADNK